MGDALHDHEFTQGQGWQKPVFLKKAQPGGCFGYYWVLLFFGGFIGVLLVFFFNFLSY
jgi:hypothetical protein